MLGSSQPTLAYRASVNLDSERNTARFLFVDGGDDGDDGEDGGDGGDDVAAIPDEAPPPATPFDRVDSTDSTRAGSRSAESTNADGSVQLIDRVIFTVMSKRERNRALPESPCDTVRSRDMTNVEASRMVGHAVWTTFEMPRLALASVGALEDPRRP